MRIRLSGDIGGAIVMCLLTFALVGVITAILEFIQKHFVKTGTTIYKLLNTVVGFLWLISVVLLVLDLSSIWPVVRNFWFAVFALISL